jgi:hypothetical protein
MMDMYFKAEVS